MLENEETSEQIKATNVRTNYKKSRNAKNTPISQNAQSTQEEQIAQAKK